MHQFTNALVHETSPYLLQHAHNPVNWRPWGKEAFEEARKEDKPIFLSVGYATCYWCHVMERESFEDEEIARVMNEHFVCIKVDREERPDVDDVYMAATQIVSGGGGWPMSVFLEPKGLKPFYAGTYFPAEDKYGRPGFGSLLRGVREAWVKQRAEIDEQADKIAEAIEAVLSRKREPVKLGSEVVRHAIAGLKGSYDPEHGGFGGG
ncbi:MAG TPA: thioredoxin domain-containing protein, partial [Phycisphaerales bacterium]|nr:thioredoxin domain-containing protein [Phycisphaerales bacterium]